MAATAPPVETGTAAPGRTKPGRLGYLEGLRGIAALYVVLGHFASMIDPMQTVLWGDRMPADYERLARPVLYGHLAVAAFIVISGFSLQLALFNRGDGRFTTGWHALRNYFKRRFLRILPPYYACLGLSLIVVYFVTSRQEGLPWEQYLPVTRENLWAHILMVHNFRPEWMYKINGVLWTISIEFQLYFTFPILIALIFRVGRIATLIITMAAAGWLLYAYEPATKLYVWYLPLFCAGAVAAHWAFSAPPTAVRRWVTGALAALLIGAGVYACGVTKELWIRDSLFGLGFAAWIAFLAWRSKGPTAWFLGWRPLLTLGAFSYSLYLVHHPILQIIYVYRPAGIEGPTERFMYLLTVGLPIILVVCYAFFWIFERPFMGALRTARPKPPEVKPVQTA